AVALLIATGRLRAQSIEWPYFGGDPGATRYSPLTEINEGNVRALERAWVWRPRERLYDPPVGREARPGQLEATPLMIGDTLFVTTPYNRVVALDAATGGGLWMFDPLAYASGQPFHGWVGFVHRGVAAWSDGHERRLFLATRWRIIALAAATGRRVAGFGRGGEVDLAKAIG